MCWKTSSPAPEPTPAAMPLSSVTEATALQGALSCPTHTYSCNSTDIMCHNGGLVCCTEHNPSESLCSCPKGYEPPDCLIQDILGESRFDSMSTAGKAGIIAFIVIVVLAFVITVVVLVIRRQRRSRRLEGHKDEDVALRGKATRVDPENQVQRNQDVGRGASGSEKNGS